MTPKEKKPGEKRPGEKRPGEKRPGEDKLEDLPAEWEREDREMEGRKPDLGEDDEDPSER
jgi:hypothetical protein